jgi:hypothetical protein
MANRSAAICFRTESSDASSPLAGGVLDSLHFKYNRIFENDFPNRTRGLICGKKRPGNR